MKTVGYGRPTLRSPGLGACGIGTWQQRQWVAARARLAGMPWRKLVAGVAIAVLGRLAAKVAAHIWR